MSTGLVSQVRFSMCVMAHPLQSRNKSHRSCTLLRVINDEPPYMYCGRPHDRTARDGVHDALEEHAQSKHHQGSMDGAGVNIVIDVGCMLFGDNYESKPMNRSMH